METFTEIISIVMSIAMACFAISTGVLYISAKKSGYTPAGVHVENKWSINLDLRFFSDLRKAYVLMGKNKIVPLINRISIYTLIISWLLIILSLFFQN
jgi:hypothetical protein